MEAMEKHVSAGLAGALLGTIPSARRFLLNITDDTDRVDSRSRKTKILVEDLQFKVQNMLASGDMNRLGNDRVSDLLVGLSYGTPGTPTPTPTATATNIPGRLAIPESAIADEGGRAWPGFTNPYNAQGLLTDPGNAFASTLARAGLLLGYKEVSALLAGVALGNDPQAVQTVQMFRLWKSISNRAAVLGSTGTGMTQAQYDAIAAAIWPGIAAATGTAAVPGGLLDILTADSGNVGATGAEEAIGPGLNIPINRFPIGRTVWINLGLFSPSANGADTAAFRLRLGTAAGLGGTILTTSTTAIVNPANAGEQFMIDCYITRRADAGGSPVFTAYTVYKSLGGAAGVLETMRMAATAIVALAPTVAAPVSPAMVVQPSVIFSAANAANLVRSEQGHSFLL